MERTGGTFLLQETKPSKLIGAMVSGVESSGLGWVLLDFSPEPGLLTINVDVGRVNGTMSRATCMAFLSIVQVLLAQIDCLRATALESSASTPTSVTNTIEVVVERKVICFSWDKGTHDAVVADVENGVELRMSEIFARRFLSSLVNALGRFAAGDVHPQQD